MGSRPNSYLGYGIAWEERDIHNEVEKLCPYEICRKLESNPEVQATIWAHEETACLFIYIGETYHWNDWDSIGKVDISKLKVKSNYDTELFKVCEQIGLEYKKPEFLLLSYYG